MEDNWNLAGNTQGLTCTAKEVFIDEDPTTGDKLINVNIIDGCDFVGDTAMVDITASIHFNSDRLDVGVYSALGGGNALTGDCAVDILIPTMVVPIYDGPGSTTVKGTTGSFDSVSKGGLDQCGDVDITGGGGGGGNHEGLAFQTLTLECVDDDGDGFLDFSTCFSWRVPGSDSFCDGTRTDVYPGTPSKCFCETVIINVPIPSPSAAPSPSPSAAPIPSPSAVPSPSPSAAPSPSPSAAPSPSPSAAPSPSPSGAPSLSPSAAPSLSPSAAPSPSSSGAPSPSPRDAPSPSPSSSPSATQVLCRAWRPVPPNADL